VLEREVRANLVYRDFTRVGGGKAPDAKTMGRWGLALGPEVLKQVGIAQDNGVTTGRRMRVDTTVVETNIHRRGIRNSCHEGTPLGDWVTTREFFFMSTWYLIKYVQQLWVRRWLHC